MATKKPAPEMYKPKMAHPVKRRTVEQALNSAITRLKNVNITTTPELAKVTELPPDRLLTDEEYEDLSDKLFLSVAEHHDINSTER